MLLLLDSLQISVVLTKVGFKLRVQKMLGPGSKVPVTNLISANKYTMETNTEFTKFTLRGRPRPRFFELSVSIDSFIASFDLRDGLSTCVFSFRNSCLTSLRLKG